MSNESILNVLRGAEHLLVEFDPENAAHRNSYRKFLVSGKQDKTFRFKLEIGYNNIPDMIRHKLVVAGLKALDELDDIKSASQISTRAAFTPRTPVERVG